LVRRLAREDCELLTVSRQDVDLRDQRAVTAWFDFRVGVEKLMFFGSSCIYPRPAQQPIREDALLTGPLEPPSRKSQALNYAGLTGGGTVAILSR
jgi:GDP-L-fucose synthase